MEYTLIKGSQVKPGMLVFMNCCVKLILSTHGKKKIECRFLNVNEGYYGSLHGHFYDNDEIELIEGKQRKEYISKILNDLFSRKYHIKNDIEMVRLIQAMDEKNNE